MMDNKLLHDFLSKIILVVNQMRFYEENTSHAIIVFKVLRSLI